MHIRPVRCSATPPGRDPMSIVDDRKCPAIGSSWFPVSHPYEGHGIRMSLPTYPPEVDARPTSAAAIVQLAGMTRPPRLVVS